VFRQRTSEFEGDLTGPLRSALLLLIVVTALGAGLTFFVLLSRLRASRREQKRLADLNDTREEFISIVSHELRTPATGQLGFLQTLLDHWGELSDEDRHKTVTQAYANARRLHALSRDVLDTASIEAGELPYAFEVIDLVGAAETAAHALPAPDREIVISGPDQPVAARADPERIQQVLTNVLDNAVKNSPAGSEIDIVVSTQDNEARVEVSDRGLGLGDDEFDRSFEKFSRGRHTGVSGTGLGLYICRMIVTAHGGSIWAERREGGGATIAFTLPLVSTRSSEGHPSETVTAER
jgi:two-component system sensor histidine kinase KdpD